MKLLALSAAIAMTAGPLGAQTTAPDKPAVQGNTVTVARSISVAEAAGSLARAAGATVLVDPSLSGTVRDSVAKQPLEQGLASIAAQTKAQWRKFYMKDADIPRTKDGAVDLRKLVPMVEAASLAPPVSIGVVDPATGMLLSATRSPLTAPATQQWLQDRKAMYVLYRPVVSGSALGVAGSDVVTDYYATQKGAMEAFMKMTPEQRRDAMKQGIEMFLNTDPEVMGQMMQQQMQAFMDLPAETKQKLMEVGMRMMGSMGNVNAPTPPPAR